MPGFGAEALLTRAEHNSGTDRLEEVASRLGLASDAIVVNVQGDEPLIPGAHRPGGGQLAAHPEAAIATLAEPIHEVSALFNPNVVKVATDIDGLALTFSRAPLPWARDAFARDRDSLPEGVPYRRHIGIYAYRVGFLADFVAWGPCWLENAESLEQLRALWHGVRIHVADARETMLPGVDTPEDLERVRRVLGADARPVRLPGQHLPVAHRRRRVPAQGRGGRSGLPYPCRFRWHRRLACRQGA